MNEQERKLALEHLRTSRERLLGLVGQLTPEQWSFHPGQNSWSIADCLEHLTKVENRVLGFIQSKLQEPPQQVSPEIREKDARLMQAVPDRAERRQAPEIARPTGQWANSEALLAEFEKVRSATTNLAQNTKADLRAFTQMHGAFGELDCYQWLLLLGLHSERHARQIEEIKTSPAFPSQEASVASA